MRVMSYYRAVQWVAVVGMWAALAFDVWQPGTRWPKLLMVVSVIVAMAGRDPQRRAVVQYRWLGPVVLLLMGAQLALMAQPADRTRMMLSAAACLVAAVILWVWHRPSE